MSFFNELKRRNVFKVGIAYIIIAWVFEINPDGVKLESDIDRKTYEPKSGGNKIASGQKLKFGKVKAKQKKKTKTITIKNTGTDDLMIDNIYEDGSKKSKKHFKENGPKNKKLAPGKSLKVKVTFKPQSKGEKMVTLRIRSNDSDEGKFDIILKGKGKK